MGGGGVRVDVNKELKVFVKKSKKKLHNIKKIKKMWGGGEEEGEGQYLNQKHSLCIQKKKKVEGIVQGT